MRRLLRPLVGALFRRDPREIERRAAGFAIHEPAGRELVTRLGEAFLGGYNTMLGGATLDEVARHGREVDVHFRPFWFEGAAMGYLPRGYHVAGCDAAGAERALLGLAPEFRYLYYVGLGFWYGFRHPRRPRCIERLAPYVDPLFLPLCYDGYGFKVGFFDRPTDRRVARLFERCPAAGRRFAYQGFGRAQFFVLMDDPGGFRALRDALPVEHAEDLEFGRALARSFTGLDRPGQLLAAAEEGGGERERAARLLGTTWGLTARRMCDAAYFESCLARAQPSAREFLVRLPDLCDAELKRASSYADWQSRTRLAVLGALEGG